MSVRLTHPMEVACSAAHIVATEHANVVLSPKHGLRIGSRALIRPDDLGSGIRHWLSGNQQRDALLMGPHLDWRAWDRALTDAWFPSAFVDAGGGMYLDFVKILLVNSLSPGLQFVQPYAPTEKFAASLLRSGSRVDACVYDPNLEPRSTTGAFPDKPLRLYTVVREEAPDVIVQTVFSVDHDLRLVCELRRLAPQATILIGGPTLDSAPLQMYLDAMPIDGIIVGDGESPLLRLAAGDRARLDEIPGVIARSSGREVPAHAVPSASLTPIVRSATHHGPEVPMTQASIWGTAVYQDRSALHDAQGSPVLPYDMIGLNRLRVVIGMRCRGRCYWCRSPKAPPPRHTLDVVAAVEAAWAEADSVHFEDNDVLFDPGRFTAVVHEMQRRGLGDKPILVKTRPDELDERRADLMYEAGVRIVGLGIESFSQACLDLLDKGTTVEDNRRALELCLERGIKPGINAIWLVPGMDLQRTHQLVWETMPYLKRGAYLNLAPELELGAVDMTPRVCQLLDAGYFRNEPRVWAGMRRPLDYVSLALSPKMAALKAAVEQRFEHLLRDPYEGVEGRPTSVAVRSLLLLRAILDCLPPQLFPGDERSRLLGDIATVSESVRRAETQRTLLYDPIAQ